MAVALTRVCQQLASYAALDSGGVDSKDVDAMTPSDFEEHVRAHLRRIGLKLESPGQEGQYDLIVTESGTDLQWLVEVKKTRQQGRIAVGPVRQLASFMASTKCTGGVLIASTDFTPSARDFASKVEPPMYLLTIGRLATCSRIKDIPQIAAYRDP